MHRLFYRYKRAVARSFSALHTLLRHCVKRGQQRYTTVIACILLLAALPSFAGGIPVVDVFDGSKAELVNGKIKEIKDNMYFTNKALILTPAAKDIITFKINEDSKLVLKTAFTATVTFRLTYTDKNNVATQTSADQTLTINYDPAKDKTYTAYSDFIFDNAYGIKIQLTKPIQFTPANPGWDPTPALLLSMEIQPAHLYKFDRVQNAVPQFTGTGVLNGAMPLADEVMTSWDPVTGASEYDLEWSYVDDYAGTEVKNLIGSANPTDADLDRLVYRNNATRVTLTDITKNYAIPLFYDGSGTLVYRIRSVQAQPNGQRLEAVWSKTAFFKYDGHQAKLNWQANTSFAEEGKRKSVLQYFDGSLRNRQTVTKDNSTNTTVVAETVYDYQGRPAVQVLPAPTLNNLINYSPNFNTLNGAAYDKDNFDLLSANRNVCKTPAAPLSNQTGAAQYYSANNPALSNTELLKKEPFHQYIPDAEGYPFTETQYMQDGTGRVSKQSGVGAQYQMGSGHETVYYYGNPDQQDLDALFGTEAGDASHYFKNMVRDANGQYSVNYTDMHGRTIATALAGKLPDGSSLSNLASKNEQLGVTRVLTDKNNNLVKGWTIESSKGLIVTKAGTNTFTYSFDPSSLVLPSCPPGNQNIYYDCLYDLEITISGECNNEFNQGQPVVYKKSNFTLGQIDVTAQPADKFSWSFPIDLPEGSYTVTKKLTISSDGLNFYRDQVFLKNNVCKTLDQFIQEQKDIFAQLQLNCNPTSTSCRIKLGTPDQFRTAYLNSNGITAPSAADEQAITIAYNNAQKECDRLATNERNGQSDIQGIYQSMLGDVTPGGQYANLDLIDKYSVFSAGANASFYKYANGTYVYRDELGNISPVQSAYGAYDANPASPASNANKFITDFKPSWSETLVQAHPEYCRYAAMRDQVGDASYTWDNDFLNTKTYAEAQAKGYLNPSGNAAFVTKYPTQFKINNANIDPLAAINPGYKSGIEGYLNTAFTNGSDAFSLWTIASAAGFCKNNADNVCTAKQKINPFDETGANCTSDLDMAWVSFRGMYYAQKRKLIATIIANACAIDYADLTKTIQAGPADDPINFQHTVYFDDPANTINHVTGLPGFNGTTIQNLTPEQIEAQKQQGYATTCSSYSSLWWDQLAPCTTEKLASQKTSILNDLVKVCTLGSDDNHLSGSSSISPSKTNTYRNFEDVIKFYVGQYNATAAAADKIDPVTCNGLLITFPLSYESPLPVNKPIFKKPDDCDCGQIALIRSKYNSLPAAGKDPSFSDYLLRTQHTSISNADLDLLTSLCTGVYQCNFLAKPVILPPGLQCGAGDVCVPCARVNAVYTSFKADYPGVIPTTADVDEPQRIYNQLFAKYMNSRLGFGKQAAEYLTFINSCGQTGGSGGGGSGNTSDCDTLQQLVTGFTNYYRQREDTVNTDPVHFKVQGPYPITANDYPLIYQNGIAHIPVSLEQPYTGWPGTAFYKYDTLCVGNEFTIEARFKNPVTSRGVWSYDTYFGIKTDAVAAGLTFMQVAPPYSLTESLWYAGYSIVDSSRSFSTAGDTAFVKSFDDWRTVRAIFKSNQLSVYMDDTLLRVIPYTGTINKLYYLANGFKGSDGYLDYYKVFDKYGTLQYTEDFNDAKQSASNFPAAFTCKPDCQSSFTQYYNQQKNTAYTYSQIDSVYRAVCGKSPDVCAFSSPLVDSLKNIAAKFPCYYTSLDDATVNTGSVCSDFSTWVTGGVTNLGYRAQNKFSQLNVSDGTLKMPAGYDYITYGGISYNSQRSFCVNNDYAFEARIKNTNGGWTLSTGMSNASVNSLPTDPDEDFGFGFEQTAGTQWWYNYRHVRTYFDPGPINRSFDDWRIVKYVAKPTKFQIFLDGALVIEVPRDGRSTIIRVNGAGFVAGNGLTLEMDWYKQYQNDELVLSEDFNLSPGQFFNAPNPKYLCPKPDCKTAFVTYFNFYYGNLGLKTFDKIDSFYMQSYGVHLDVCPAASSDSCAQNLTFIKTYGTATGSSAMYDLKQTPDGGYVTTGFTTGFGAVNTDAHITKLSRTGSVEWSKTYGSTQSDYLANIQTTADGGYIAIGTANSAPSLAGGQIWVIKTDKNGNKQWSKTFGGSTYGNVGNRVIQTSDGGYAFNGFYNYVAGGSDYVVTRLTPAGDITWTKQFGTGSSDQPGAIFEDGDSLVLTSMFWNGSYYNTVMTKIGKNNGTPGWAKAYDIDSKSNWWYDVFKTNTGYSIFGYNGEGPGGNIYGNMVQVSPGGDPIRSIRVNRAVNSVVNNGQVSLRPTPDGGFIVAESNEDSEGDIYLQRSDATGAMVWANRIKIPGKQSPGQIIQNADGSYTMGGASGGNMLLLKVNLQGTTGCNDSSLSITNTLPAVTVLNNNFSYPVNTTVALAVADMSNDGVARSFDTVAFCLHDPCAQTTTDPLTGPLLCGRNEALVKEIDNYHEDTPCDDLLQFSTSRGMEQYKIYTEKITGEFTNNYIAECLKAVDNESFTVKQDVSEYHYTLYYYDQAGNLVKTVPPAGVQANYSQDWMTAVKAARDAHTDKPQVHTLVTQYRYNTLNQVIAQQTPDAGLSEFWYDRLGRLAVSQNAKQKAASNNYSYTKYDYMGRVNEVGQINTPATAMADATSRFPVVLDKWFTDNAAKRQQVTSTYYDLQGAATSSGLYVTINIHSLRNRTSFISFTAGNNPVNYNAATYYNYDIHGNVSTLLQDYTLASNMGAKGQQFKRIDYQYDLISGKVNEVAYQNGYKDQFFHRYSYDADNRITAAYTSTDYTRWEQDANYQYYKHGPLARAELGNQHVQGMDYAYTLQGWLKSVNGTVVSGTGGATDMGGDGSVNNSTRAQDVYGYSLQYNDADYRAIGNTQWLTGVKSQLSATNGYRPLFNGNISSMAVNLPVNAGTRGGAPMLYNYSYDQLNRLVAMDAFKGNNTGNQLWDNGLAATEEWMEKISYDANGNILTYLRNGTTAGGKLKGMDNLVYGYNKDANGNLVNNKLRHVKDDANLSGNYTEDIDSQGDDNYGYDAIGNLTQDGAEKISAINWSVYGKMLSIAKTGVAINQPQLITYAYDASGNRINKTVKKQGVTLVDDTWYVRDASGNVMAVYELGNTAVNGGHITLREQHIYGSSRLGIRNPDMDIDAGLVIPKTSIGNITTKSFLSNLARGNKFFELSNHLGNVLVTISDKKIGHTSDNSTIDYYNADVSSAYDYAPFGMQLAGKKFNSGGYRYGFNGRESDNEVKGEGNAIDYGERSIYDPRLGRFLSVDVNFKNIPSFSPYQFARNSPLMLKENGKDGIIPKWLWQTGIINPLAAGFIDAIADDVKGLGSIAETITAFNPQSYYFYTPDAAQVRHETWETTKTILEVMSNPVLQNIVLASVYEDVSKAIKTADGSDYAYATGYAAWNVLSFFIGVGEVAEFAKTGKIGAGLSKFIGILEKSETKIDHLANIIKRSATHINDLEWHHIIPTQLKELDIVQDAIGEGYKFEEELANKIPLEKYLNINKEGVHGNHPRYTKQITDALNKFKANNPNYSGKQAKAVLEDINLQIQKVIDENPSTKLNELNLNLQVKSKY